MLFAMSPKGTGQAEYCGSDSYRPNGIFFALAIADHATMVVGIVTGHNVGFRVVCEPPLEGAR